MFSIPVFKKEKIEWFPPSKSILCPFIGNFSKELSILIVSNFYLPIFPEPTLIWLFLQTFHLFPYQCYYLSSVCQINQTILRPHLTWPISSFWHCLSLYPWDIFLTWFLRHSRLRVFFLLPWPLLSVFCWYCLISLVSVYWRVLDLNLWSFFSLFHVHYTLGDFN